MLALGLLTTVASAEAGVAAASRARLISMAAKGARRAPILRRYVDERASILASLAVARNLAVVLATALGVFLITRALSLDWPTLLVTVGVAVIVLTLLDALPRLIVAQSPERWGMRLVPVVGLFKRVFGPVAWAIDRSLRAVMPPNGDDARPDGAEDLIRLVEMEEAEASIEPEEREMIRGIIGMEDTTAREIMVPRMDIVALDAEASIDNALQLIVERGFSRIPLYEETIDNIVGVIYAKDLLRCLAEHRRPALTEIARPAYFIPETKRVDELLSDLRKSKVHIAVVVDEYGGTAGLVTIEDLLEEIVGEIQDEYDLEETPIERVNDEEAILDGRVSIDALSELFGFEPAEELDYDTVGGFVYHHLGKVPVAGDEVRLDGLTLRVLSVLGRRIKKIRATRVARGAEAPAG